MTREHVSLEHLEQRDDFIHRHIGPDDQEISEMLSSLDLDSLDALIQKAIPENILAETPFDLGDSQQEYASLQALRKVAAKNTIYKCYIGMGYYPTVTPPVILRNILEDPAWYTAYTPYQAEISQGRLEALLNYQTMVCDLTGMEIANASLLDEATAAAEAMALCFASRKRKEQHKTTYWVMNDIHPQTLEVLETRAEPLGIQLQISELDQQPDPDQCFGMLFQYPTSGGAIKDLTDHITWAKENRIMTTVAADILSLVLLKAPGEMGADIAIGSTQRFGVPLGFGGPHAAYFATLESNKRLMPGRIVGVSRDKRGKLGYRLALQTREQHIRRERATSNICTSQVLLAVIAGMYATFHGPTELRRIAGRVHRLAAILAKGLAKQGHSIVHEHYFDTIRVTPAVPASDIRAACEAQKLNIRYFDNGDVGIAIDEIVNREDIRELWSVFGSTEGLDFDALAEETGDILPEGLLRQSDILTHEVFNSHHSETEMLRYLNTLSSRDLSLNHSMIPLGSCTMKLNATSEMIPVTWFEFHHMHPFAPADQAQGYAEMIGKLEHQLAEITGFPGISLQPNAGSQGEYAGLMVIRRYHQARGEDHRNICIIPSSAHGTNPASAVMAGMKVVVVACDDEGNIDIADLQEKASKHKDALAALMVTYPSTHGVFETGIRQICEIIHDHGGQVYMDGANMNALVGLCKPGEFGPDVCHLNLHKTFCIPHGGGGPGVGPIGVGAHLKPYLPGHRLRKESFGEEAGTAISAAPWGSAGILPISYMYITMMGLNGLKKATQVAILNANYIAKKLEGHYKVLYRGPGGMIAHECILDVRPFKTSAGIEVEDIAKRLMDYGFHAPTMSWPVAGTLMVEPTESESKGELDRFIETMIAIRAEIAEIEKGEMDKADNPLKHAPHTLADLVDDTWDRPYDRRKAVYPLPWLTTHKFWPAVGRVDNVYGDKNLVCSCPAVSEYQ
jgi:glycine dehydrogenase